MRPRRLLVFALLAVLAGSPAAWAEDPPAEPSREATLQARAQEWLRSRRDLFRTCGTCQGSGVVQRPGSPGPRFVACPRCRGLRTRVDRDAFYRLHYDLMSPAWRRQKGDRTQMEATWVAMDAGNGRPAVVRTFRVVRVELASDRHGIVRYHVNGEREERTSRWVWAAEEGRPARWWIHGGEVDGSFGAPGCDPEAPGRTPLDGAAAEAVRTRLQPLALRHQVLVLARAGSDLVLVLHREGAVVLADRDAGLRDDAIALARAFLEADQPWRGVRLSFHGDWMDRFGRVARKPYANACLSREVFERIVWPNLSSAEAFALFAVERPVHPELRLRSP